ncbi:hypothetical protein O1611_g618 [Lasiodiplodia mahajangana]|uniref:Uncharacterized protein n=1 Tax=Lasiodiplodia mahajangana TaxID=1108764 RepID=A0ACC2JZT9_9PEZI|nr:hypothetical protein O1611_g618 [Lasiodiplodia mahajangana]
MEIRGQQATIWGLGIAFPILSIAAVALRFQARRIKGQKIGSDDWTILVALILTIGLTINLLIMTQLGGLGTHEQLDENGLPIDTESALIFGKTIYVLEILTWPTVGVTKISVLLLYKRIFTTPRFIMTVWVLIGFVIAWTIAFIFALAFSCTPVDSQWDYTLDFTCVDLVALFTTALATDVATDFLVLLLPVYKVWRLQLSRSRRILIIGIFLLGVLVSIVGLIRIGFLTQIYNVLSGSAATDTTWYYAPVYYWTIIETNVGVLSACLPTLRPIQERITHKFSFSRMHLLLSSREKSNDIPLGSMEEGLNFQSKDSHPNSQQRQAFYRVENIDSQTPPVPLLESEPDDSFSRHSHV